MKTVKRKPTVHVLLYLLAFTLLGLSGCKEKEAEEPPKEAVEAPSQIVSVEDARTMYNNYTERRARVIQRFEDSRRYDQKQQMQQAEAEVKKDSFDVARYGYYDYKTLKQYLAYIEQEAAKANVEISSMRFYFSNYADMKTFKDGDPVLHPGQNSFFLVPATKKGDRDYAFFLREVEAGKIQPVFLNGRLQEVGKDGMGMTADEHNKAYASFIPYKLNSSNAAPSIFNGDISTFMNEGSMVPPPHN